MCVDGARTVDLAELALHGGEAQAHLGGLFVGQNLEGTFVDGSGCGEPVIFGCFCDVDCEELQV